MAGVINDKFRYVYSSVLHHKVTFKLGTLEGKLWKPTAEEILRNPLLKHTGFCQPGCADLYLIIQLFENGEALAIPKHIMKSFTTRYNFNEWVQLPLLYSDLPEKTIMIINIYTAGLREENMIVGGTAIPLFDKSGLFRQGIIDLRIWTGIEADPKHPEKTPFRPSEDGQEKMPRLAELVKKHQAGLMPKVDWLDRLTFREIEQTNEREKRLSDHLYLMVEFMDCMIDGHSHNIIYFEQNGEEVYAKEKNDIITVPDPEIGKENLVENMYHKITRSMRSGYSDRDAKPNAYTRDFLNRIVSYPPTKQLTNEEQDIVWKYRFFLSNQKKALSKFLKCVRWTQNSEVNQAMHMMDIWVPMDIEDALELLSSSFTHVAARRYAITRLSKAPDEDIILYLLELVQALKFENFESIKNGLMRLSKKQESASKTEEKEAQLVHNDSKESNSTLTEENVLQKSSGEEGACALPTLTSKLKGMDLAASNLGDSANTDTLKNQFDDEVLDLASFLIQRASQNTALANYFYWYLLLECEDNDNTQQDKAVQNMYLNVMKMFRQTLAQGNAEMQNRRIILSKQQKFIDRLVKLIKTVSKERGDRKKKIEVLKQLLATPDSSKFSFTNFEPIPFPLDPDVTIRGIVAEKSLLFKSALMPSKLYFVTDDDREYVAIFKYGDDLRQDQLVLQMITLMDKLLRKENLDLKLTPYKVLATSTKHGFVQFIDSITVADALASEGSIQNYFKKHHPQENGPYGIAPDIMNTFVRSCAGYCVITYLLGVGDRHLDNLLLTPCGKLFHIDFGYILGRDPKPLPPPMRLSREMVEAMGGVTSEHYQEFRTQCHTAFLHLRRHANLMLNLFSLMIKASIPDIALEPDKAVKKLLEKLRLELSEEEAVQYIQQLIDASASAVMPVIVEQFHKFTQLMRK
ncbi:phosphatidylinositol 3-kinase catalytic subunit type 3 [Coccinella septempunctata]|uniref:phosphatidylinositol 3-kinase catalytic subunit type 3 n=1 Tax=Coccinella septempunctata TaxID=41139 RepID=UPI001D08BFB4|nr:phosphatidylinositol 3-kinase catalytic subunit type 3 [Coccinella septempunctata]